MELLLYRENGVVTLPYECLVIFQPACDPKIFIQKVCRAITPYEIHFLYGCCFRADKFVVWPDDTVQRYWHQRQSQVLLHVSHLLYRQKGICILHLLW